MAVLGLHCCMQAFSGCEQGILSWALGHPGFSSYNTWAQQLPCRLQSVGSVLVAHRLSCPAACEIFPDQGLNPWSPTLAGRFLTTGPPGKSTNKKETQRGKVHVREVQIDRYVTAQVRSHALFLFKVQRGSHKHFRNNNQKPKWGRNNQNWRKSRNKKNVSLKVESLRSSAFFFV